jgi:hypothetical protein
LLGCDSQGDDQLTEIDALVPLLPRSDEGAAVGEAVQVNETLGRNSFSYWRISFFHFASGRATRPILAFARVFKKSTIRGLLLHA